MSQLPGLMLQATASHIPLMAEYAANLPLGGVVLTGRDITANRLRLDFPHQEIIVDPGDWRYSFSSPSQPFIAPSAPALFDVPMSDYVSELVDAGVNIVLSPSLTIRPNDFDAVTATLAACDVVMSEHFLPTIVVPHSMLGGFSGERLCKILRAFGRAVALIAVGESRVLQTADRLSHIRQLVREGLVSHLLSIDAVLASDALASGAAGASIGLTSSLRIPRAPRVSGPHSQGFYPGVFIRSLLEIRSPSVVADWFAGSSSAPSCQSCGSLAMIDLSLPEARAKIIAHNVHALADFAAECAGVPDAFLKEWVSQERLRALTAHPTGTSSQANLALRLLVAIDHGPAGDLLVPA